MRFIILNVALVMFITLAGVPVSALEQCRQISVKADREACYDRQAKALAQKRQAAGPDKRKVDPVDELKIENDRVSKRLRGICRGC
jgi:hypothetical protein